MEFEKGKRNRRIKVEEKHALIMQRCLELEEFCECMDKKRLEVECKEIKGQMAEIMQASDVLGALVKKPI